MRFWKGEFIMATVVIQKRTWKKGVTYSILYAHPITGNKRYFRTCKRYKEAQQEANELRRLLDSGKLPDSDKRKLNPLTFEEVAASLREEWIRRVKRKKLRSKTHSDYLIWLNVLQRIFGKRLLCQIARKEVVEFMDEELEKNSAVSANKYLTVLRAVFKQALTLHAITENPVADVPLLDEKEHERKNYLLPDDLSRLVEASRQTKAKFYMPAIICLGAEHGASRQEILDLVWPKVNFDYAGKGIIQLVRTKNQQERTEFLMPRTREMLLAWRDHQSWMRHRKKVDHDDSTYVFCRLNGQPIKRFDKAWRETCRIAGIKDFHFHDLRHTFCSNLLLSGADLKDVKEMIGHADIAMTDRYSHLSLGRKAFRQEQLALHYSNLTT